MSTSSHAEATVVYPGDIKGRPTIELRISASGESEAFLVPTGGSPVPTGIALVEQKGNYFLNCLIRKKKLRFKPEEVVRQKVLASLIDEFGYSENQINVEVPVVMGGLLPVPWTGT